MPKAKEYVCVRVLTMLGTKEWIKSTLNKSMVKAKHPFITKYGMITETLHRMYPVNILEEEKSDG